MRIKMTTGLSGPDICLTAGDSKTFDDVEGQRLIDAGFAELDTTEPAPAPEQRQSRRRTA